jgi:glycosyltransferase involved in cell wall biosynthesis
MNKSLISVILPVYNCQQYIKDSVSSILQQTYNNFEIIIIDDGSDDGTAEILNTFKDKRIKLYKNKSNRGLIYSLNKGISKSKGKFIARMDSDDISEPQRFEKQINFLNKNKEISVVGSAITTINSGNKTGKKYFYPLNHIVIKWHLLFSCPIVHPSVLIRVSAIKKLKGYDNQAKFAEDYSLWFKFIKADYKFANLRSQLLKLRKHQHSVTVENYKEHLLVRARISQKMIKYNFKFIKKIDFRVNKCIISLGEYEQQHSESSINFIFKIFIFFILKNSKVLSIIDFNYIKKNALRMTIKIWLRNIIKVNIFNFLYIILKIFFLKFNKHVPTS